MTHTNMQACMDVLVMMVIHYLKKQEVVVN